MNKKIKKNKIKKQAKKSLLLHHSLWSPLCKGLFLILYGLMSVLLPGRTVYLWTIEKLFMNHKGALILQKPGYCRVYHCASGSYSYLQRQQIKWIFYLWWGRYGRQNESGLKRGSLNLDTDPLFFSDILFTKLRHYLFLIYGYAVLYNVILIMLGHYFAGQAKNKGNQFNNI